MSNNEFFSLERNNYFKGKQLTVRDFQDEQSYYINKRRIMNYAMLGSGVVTGLDVVAVDNMRLTIESGMAVDGAGREIVLTLPVVKAVNVIEGFDSIDDKQEVYLCIEYADTPCEPSYSIVSQDEKLFNRIKEGYRIFLTNRKPSNLTPGLSAMLQTTRELYLSDGISVKMTVPKYVNKNSELEITIIIEKCNLCVPLEINFDIETSGLEAIGADKHNVRYFNAADTYNKTELKYLFRPVSGKSIGKIIIPDVSFSVVIDKARFDINQETEFTTEIIENSLKERLINDYMQRDIDSIVNSMSIEPIYLAELRIMITKNNGFVEKLEKLPFRQYIMSNGLAFLLNYINETDKKEEKVKKEALEDNNINLRKNVEEKQPDKRVNSCGIENISIEKDNRGKIYYSSEIIHNLGAGEVSYELGFEIPMTADENTIMFGEENLFAKSPYTIECPQVRYSIISYNSKGTFRIAIQLLEKINAGNLKIHWYATRHGGDFDRKLMEMDNISISIMPASVNILPRESIKLECHIQGSDDVNCIWKVEDEQGGTIDNNGIYTAPSKAGVYEVTAASVKYPTKKASNYIVVSSVKNM